ncbi:hypothetical protein cypCar_00016176 [Cyprinus carpio]|nr:hypothetical protein cypCar_00016176 [Cyprinus carpio]
MRRLNRKKALNFVKEMDAFPKVPESYVETTASGGTANYELILNITVAMSQFVERLSYYRDMVASDGLQYEPDFRAIPHPRVMLLYSSDNQMFQYFITIVPTKLQTYKVSADTHQYSVTERERVINHAAGSHGVSGIFMKYDISSLMVKVTEQHMPFWQFLVRLCGIIGGIFSTTGMLHGLVGFCVDVVCCRFKLGVYKPKSMSVFDGHVNSLTPLLSENAEH